MRELLIALVFAVAVIALVLAVYPPQCNANSPDGFRIGNILLFGCDRSNNRCIRQREELR